MNGSVVGGSPQNPKLVSVGHRISLAATVEGLPAGVSVASHSWTITGNLVGNYETSASMGKVSPYSASLSSNTIFYWIDSDNQTRQTVAYRAVLSDQRTVSSTATFLVIRPAPHSFNGETLTSAINIGTGLLSGNPSLNFGTPTDNGINFVASVVSTFGGTLGCVQLVDFSNVFAGTDGTQTTKASGGFVLDGGFPYDNIQPSIPAGAEMPSQKIIRDSPAIELLPSDQRVRTTQSFRTYFIYRPPGDGSIWVTLRIVQWNWSAQATRTGTDWALDSDPPYHYSANPSGSDSSMLPEWSRTVQDVLNGSKE